MFWKYPFLLWWRPGLWEPVLFLIASSCTCSICIIWELVRDGDSRSHLSLPALYRVTRTFCVVLCSSPQWDSRACSSSPGAVFRPEPLSLSKTLAETTEFHREAMQYNGNNTAQRARKLNSSCMSSSVTLNQTLSIKWIDLSRHCEALQPWGPMTLWRHIAMGSFLTHSTYNEAVEGNDLMVYVAGRKGSETGPD